MIHDRPAVGTQVFQGDLTGGEHLYGIGTLHADVSAGATSLVVDTEYTDVIFTNGDLIRVSSQDGVDDQTGKEDWVRLVNPGGVSWNGSQATLTFLYGSMLANAYLATNTRVASCYEVGTIPTAIPKGFWLKQTVPAGTQSISANSSRVGAAGFGIECG